MSYRIVGITVDVDPFTNERRHLELFRSDFVVARNMRDTLRQLGWVAEIRAVVEEELSV